MAKYFSEAELRQTLDTMRMTPPGRSLPLRRMICADCAVECKFYEIYSEALRLAPPEERLTRSKGWFCHNTPGQACKGNAVNLGLEW